MQEMNEGSEICRFLQIWVMPDRRGHKPQYGSSKYTKEDRHNRCDRGGDGGVSMHACMHARHCFSPFNTLAAALPVPSPIQLCLLIWLC